MDEISYKEMIKTMRARKSLGQSFLVNKKIARLEAAYAKDRKVLEIGPGLGMLTKELCSIAKSVVAIEYDQRLFEFLKNNFVYKNLKLINGDFFKVQKKEFKGIEIVVSNIPYALSSRVIFWLAANKMPAVLCLQKEFVEHMLAKPNTRNYSRLSVVSSIQFDIKKIIEVAPSNFYPEPKVSSTIAYIKPVKILDSKSIETIALIMNHKKKKISNAILDSKRNLGISKEKALEIIEKVRYRDRRAFQLEPLELKELAEQINKLLE